jgi:phosphatidylinositol alpha 1,6-mannosyltransferase
MIVTDQYAPMVGGVPTVTRELARGLSERGHAVAVIAPGPSVRGGPAAGRPPRPADPVAVDYRGSLPWPWYEGQRLGLLRPAAARQAIAAFAPDVLHLHSPLTLGLAASAGA